MKKKIFYARFWDRILALLIDTFMILPPITLIIALIFGYDSLKNPKDYPLAGILQMLMVFIVTISFWYKTGQTPGKKATSIFLVDAKTYKRPRLYKLIFRFLFYFISMLSVLGFFIPLFRKDKRALHDLLSGTCLIYKKDSN